MKNGGKREGAGRKPGTKAKLAELYNELLAKEVAKEKLPIITALITRAKTGDIAAIKEIHDRLMGKAEQPITGKDGGPIEQRIIYLPQREPMATSPRKTNRSITVNA